MNFNIEKLILDATQYDGVRKNPFTYSASMSGNTLLQNYLIIVHGHAPDEIIGDNTTGSMFHLGMQKITEEKANSFEGLTLVPEEKASLELSSGWTISGTTDLSVYNKSGRLLQIHDYKLVKQYKVKMLLKDVQADSYAMQLHINRAIRLHREDSVTPMKMYIEAFSKDAKVVDGEKTYNQIEVGVVESKNTFDFLIAETNKIKEWVESGQVPPECTNDEKWLRKLKNGTVIPSRCMFYCSHGRTGKCPYYKPTVRQATAVMSNWQ